MSSVALPTCSPGRHHLGFYKTLWNLSTTILDLVRLGKTQGSRAWLSREEEAGLGITIHKDSFILLDPCFSTRMEAGSS